MKNTFVVTITLLLALTIGGSIAGYNTAVHHEEAGHEEPRGDGTTEGNAARNSDEPPSPESSTTTAVGAENPTQPQGNVMADTTGGTQSGEEGAVAASGRTATGSQPSGATTEGSDLDQDDSGQTGQQPAEMAEGAETQGDGQAGAKTYASSCAGCHGAEAKGGVGPSLVNADGPKAWTLAQFTTTLREGKTPERELSALMPRFTDAQLTDSDIANIYWFLKTQN